MSHFSLLHPRVNINMPNIPDNTSSIGSETLGTSPPMTCFPRKTQQYITVTRTRKSTLLNFSPDILRTEN